MRIHLLLLLTSLALFSTSSEAKLSDKNSQLQLEKELYQENSPLLNEVIEKGGEVVRGESREYSQLLYAIAYEYKYGIFKEDSILLEAIESFKEREDYYNLGRALLYLAIAQYEKGEQDNFYNSITEAKAYYSKSKVEDCTFGSTLNYYLGLSYRSSPNNQMAISSFEKSIEYGEESLNKNSMLSSTLELFSMLLIEKKYREGFKLLSLFAEVNTLPPHIKIALNSALYTYHLSRREYENAIGYLKKILTIDPSEVKVAFNLTKFNYQVANSYKQMGVKDSALHYARRSISTIPDSTAYDGHFYYRYLADLLYENNSFEEASELYRKAYYYYLISYNKFSLHKEQELMAKYNFEEQQRELSLLNEERERYKNLLFTTIVIIALIFLVTLLLTKRWREKRGSLYSKMEKIDKKFRKNWLTSELYRSNSSIVPQLLDSIYKESLRSRKLSKESYEKLNEIIDQANSATRASISSIVNEPLFNEIFNKDGKLNPLTDFEKLVFALNEERYNQLEIAHFLNSSEASIRTIKGRIVRKMQNEVEENNKKDATK